MIPVPRPNGAGVALYVAVGVVQYRPGAGHVEDILDGVPQPDHVNPDLLDAGRAAGAEMVAHGASNSDCLADMAPHDDHTFDALAEAGYDYLLDLRMDNQPVCRCRRLPRPCSPSPTRWS